MHRSTTRQGIELIKYFEGFKPKAYMCPGHYMTIGYGHKIAKDEKYSAELTMTIAEDLLQHDLIQSEKAVLKYINVTLTDNQFDALVSFTFNLGRAALQRSTLRQKINYGDYREAADEFTRWIYAGGRKLKGLVKRRYVERALFLS